MKKGKTYVRERENRSIRLLCSRVAYVGSTGDIYTVHGEMLNPLGNVAEHQKPVAGDYIVYAESVDILEVVPADVFERYHNPIDGVGIDMFSLKIGRLAIHAYDNILGHCMSNTINTADGVYKSVRNSNIYWKVR